MNPPEYICVLYTYRRIGNEKRRSRRFTPGLSLAGSHAAHRQGQLFNKAGHGTRRAHDAAGSNGGAEAAADELGFGCVDVSGAVLPPEAAAIGAGAEDFAFVVADEAWGWFRSEY
jgi:hypothetical protein